MTFYLVHQKFIGGPETSGGEVIGYLEGYVRTYVHFSCEIFDEPEMLSQQKDYYFHHNFFIFPVDKNVYSLDRSIFNVFFIPQ